MFQLVAAFAFAMGFVFGAVTITVLAGDELPPMTGPEQIECVPREPGQVATLSYDGGRFVCRIDENGRLVMADSIDVAR